MPISFFRFITKDKSCLRFLQIGAVLTIAYFILLRICFPLGSYWFDSIPYIEAASNGLEISSRPIGYSHFISFFHSISHSNGILIFAQYISNVIANLFLFFTVLYFFPIKKGYQTLLFILLMCNPLYALYSNYILSDAFFCSFSIIWFTSLLWIMYQPKWVYFFIQLIVLYGLFCLRYNAIIYPFIAALAYLFSKQSLWKKIIGISATFLVIIIMIKHTTHKSKEETGVAIFSGFSGWQLANNSVFALEHVNLDSTKFTSESSKKIGVFIKHFYDSLRTNNIPRWSTNKYDYDINTYFIWGHASPLRQYMFYYLPRFYDIYPSKSVNRHITSWTANGPIFETEKKQPQYNIASWIAMGPVLQEFGTEAIKKYPFQYLHYFILPAIKLYFHPLMEAYTDYLNYSLDPNTAAFYDYTPNEIDINQDKLIWAFMSPLGWISTLINALFLLLVAAYYFMCDYRNDSVFNRSLIFYLFFYISNFLFTIIVTPTVFRYQVGILTLCLIFTVYLWQRVLNTRIGYPNLKSQKSNDLPIAG